MKLTTQINWILLFSIISLVGCGGDSDDEASRDQASTPAPEILAIFTEKAPNGVVSVAELLVNPEVGKAVSVEGQIGGAVSPFGDGYAVFFLTDSVVTFCDEIDDEHCPTPWDACCENPDKVLANRILVRFEDGSGEILPYGLNGVKGLSGLHRVVVSGTVESAQAGGGYVINGTTVFQADRESVGG